MKICLCGSTRFMNQFEAANLALTLAGHIVHTVATPSSESLKLDLTPEQKMMLDAVHLRKIDDSEAVIIVGQLEDGSYYLGESTTREIAYALSRDIQVGFYEPGREVTGPFHEVLEALQEASMTTAQKEERIRKANEERNAHFAQIFGHGQEQGGSVDNQPIN